VTLFSVFTFIYYSDISLTDSQAQAQQHFGFSGRSSTSSLLNSSKASWFVESGEIDR
jgi:hypothetical protein